MSRSGVYEPQSAGFRAFIPAVLPPDPAIVIDSEMQRLLSRADRNLAELKGVTRILPNPQLFVLMYMRKEAVLSSQIEGTQSSLNDVLKAEAAVNDPNIPKDADEVLNYLAAMKLGLELIKTLPPSARVIRQIHARLMQDVQGGNRMPGEFRNGQVHIGAPGGSIREAVFVPPPPGAVPDAIADLERYINTPDDLPPLIRIGLAHSQFETIHPFFDGNGRTGRLLIAFLLCTERLLEPDKPVLYLSHYFKANRQDYYERLQATRDKSDFESWIKFFLAAVAETSERAIAKAAQITAMRERLRSEVLASQPRGSFNAVALLEQLFLTPIISAAVISTLLGITSQSARTLLGRFETLGIISEITGKDRNKKFQFTEFINLVSDD